MEETKKKGKFWIFEMYEDSRPQNWYEILEKTMLKICISPRHDKDKKENSEEFKKPHYHVLICFEGPTTYNVVLNIAKQVGANIVFQCYSVVGSWEYFIHKNNPDKAQYKIEDYIYINGFDIEKVVDLSPKEIDDLKREVIHIIREQKITEYSVLYDILIDNDLIKEAKVVSNNTIFFVSYLKSKKYSCVSN